jgi:hypothetical protein
VPDSAWPAWLGFSPYFIRQMALVETAGSKRHGNPYGRGTLTDLKPAPSRLIALKKVEQMPRYVVEDMHLPFILSLPIRRFEAAHASLHPYGSYLVLMRDPSDISSHFETALLFRRKAVEILVDGQTNFFNHARE